MTLTEARDAWVAANPFPQKMNEGGVQRDTTLSEYNAMADDRAQGWLEEDARIQTQAVKEAKAQQFSTGMKTLRDNLTFMKGLSANTNLTGAQVKKGMIDTTESLIWLGETLRDYGVFRWDDL